MIKFIKEIIKYYQKTTYYKVTLIYLALGAYIFTIGRSDYSYFDLICYGLSHPFIMSIFLIPVVSLTINYFKTNIFNNYNVLLRLKNRTNLKRLILLTNFIIISKILLFYLAVLFILTNIIANRNTFINYDNYYGISNILLIFYHFIKNFILLYIISIFTSQCNKKRYILECSIIVIISCSFLGFIPNNMLMIFPAYYVSSYHLFENIYKDIIFSIFYLVLIFIINYINFNRKWNSDLI